MIIHNGVGQKNFINAAAAKIERRSVNQGAPRSNGWALTAWRAGQPRPFSFGLPHVPRRPVAARKAHSDPCLRPAARGSRTRP
jgi:hypothetical protein